MRPTSYWGCALVHRLAGLARLDVRVRERPLASRRPGLLARANAVLADHGSGVALGRVPVRAEHVVSDAAVDPISAFSGAAVDVPGVRLGVGVGELGEEVLEIVLDLLVAGVALRTELVVGLAAARVGAILPNNGPGAGRRPELLRWKDGADLAKADCNRVAHVLVEERREDARAAGPVDPDSVADGTLSDRWRASRIVREKLRRMELRRKHDRVVQRKRRREKEREKHNERGLNWLANDTLCVKFDEN